MATTYQRKRIEDQLDRMKQVIEAYKVMAKKPLAIVGFKPLMDLASAIVGLETALESYKTQHNNPNDPLVKEAETLLAYAKGQCRV